MTTERAWDVGAEFSEIAATVRRAYFSSEQSWLQSCPADLKARCWNSLTGTSWNEDVRRTRGMGGPTKC
jgi:hypothetical protein